MILIRSTPDLSPFFPTSYFSVLNALPSENEEQNEIPVHAIQNVQVVEQVDTFSLSMDLPGVKEQDIKISEEDFILTIEALRKRGDQEVCKFYRKFSLDEKSIQPDGIKASLADGILTVSIPKTPTPKTIDITPLESDPPEAETEGKEMRFRLDMPGVKLADVKVNVTGDELFISAQRQKGSITSTFKRYFNLDEKVDTQKLTAYLMDGVLTLTAPMKDEPIGKPVMSIRSFPVVKPMIEEGK